MAGATDEELEKKAQEMAEKALPATLPQAVRSSKLPTVMGKILEKLKKQRDDARQPACTSAKAPPQPVAAAPIPSTAPGAPPPPSTPPPVAGVAPKEPEIIRIEGVELFGDEPWFANQVIRKRLRDSVIEAHREQKILVGPPAEEVARICPGEGRSLAAGGILRLGGAHQGGYGEPDIAYAYRQLARAIHPDKNPGVTSAPMAFKRLSEAQEEMKQGLLEQRSALQVVAGFTNGGRAPAPELLERPQEALFAESCRTLAGVLAIAAEGTVHEKATARTVAAFSRIRAFETCQPQSLLNEWFQRDTLLNLFGGAAVRTAYDCAPKRCRAQFLCLLHRVLAAETARYGEGCIRGNWSVVMQSFPELYLWRELLERLKIHVWNTSQDAFPVSIEGDEPMNPEPPPPEPPKELDPKEKAMMLLEKSWEACSGPEFQNAYDQLRKRGKVTLQMGMMQLLESATTEAANQMGLPSWKWQHTVDLVKLQREDDGIRKKAIELERMLQQPPGRLFGLKPPVPSKSKSRDRKRKRSRSRRRRRKRSSSSSSSSSRKRGRSRRRRDDEKKKEDEKKKNFENPVSVVSTNGAANKEAAAEKKEPEKKIIYRRKWDALGDDHNRKCAGWARKWRTVMGNIFPSGQDAAVSLTDPAVRKLGAAIWKDVLQWARGPGDGHRCLNLFTADKQSAETFGWAGASKAPRGLDPEFPQCEWAFVPLTDIFLVIGEGVVGVTAEGIFAETDAGFKNFTFEEYWKKVTLPPLDGKV